MARRTVAAILLVGLAGCGGAGAVEPAGAGGAARVREAVAARLDQRLMQASPREAGANSPTHVRGVACVSAGPRRWTCTATLGDGERTTVHARLRPDGEIEVR